VEKEGKNNYHLTYQSSKGNIKNSQALTFHVKEIGAYSLRVGEGELSKLKTLSYSSN
jgi:hypothetical protein